MLQSQLFPRTQKTTPKDEESPNAVLLTRGGFVEKLMAGVYSYLPLGYAVLKNIERIVVKEMTSIGGQQLFMPSLQPKELWDKTGRWQSLAGIMYQFTDRSKRPVGLAATHEEVLTDIIRRHIQSYKDLPLALFQIQTKFRDEARAKSGLLRGREFPMKDLYSFHANEQDLDTYYQRVIKAYHAIFALCDLETILTEASGGSFSKERSHEFQVLAPNGEDTIVFCPTKDYAQNKEIAEHKAGASCPQCGQTLKEASSIEVGNIFKLGTKYADALDANYVDASGEMKPIVMASYGIGLGRLMGTIVETHHDEQGILWPKTVTPFQVHLIDLHPQESGKQKTLKIYDALRKEYTVLYDDRPIAAGAKLKDADLLGMPVRLITSEKTGENIEMRFRNEQKSKVETLEPVIKKLQAFYAI